MDPAQLDEKFQAIEILFQNYLPDSWEELAGILSQTEELITEIHSLEQPNEEYLDLLRLYTYRVYFNLKTQGNSRKFYCHIPFTPDIPYEDFTGILDTCKRILLYRFVPTLDSSDYELALSTMNDNPSTKHVHLLIDIDLYLQQDQSSDFCSTVNYYLQILFKNQDLHSLPVLECALMLFRHAIYPVIYNPDEEIILLTSLIHRVMETPDEDFLCALMSVVSLYTQLPVNSRFSADFHTAISLLVTSGPYSDRALTAVLNAIGDSVQFMYPTEFCNFMEENNLLVEIIRIASSNHNIDIQKLWTDLTRKIQMLRDVEFRRIESIFLK